MHADSADLAPRDGSSHGGASRPWWLFGCSAELSASDIKNYRRYQVLLFFWAVLFVGSAWVLKRHGEVLGPVAAYAVAALPSVLFVISAAAYVHFLRRADELTRKIHVEGMAIGFGVGLTCMLGYPLLQMAGAPPLHLSYASLIPTMAGYVWGILWAQRRYR